MKIARMLLAAIVAAVFLSPSGGNAAETLNGAGASFPYPLYSSWAFDYNKAFGIQLNYQSIGSGGGVKQIVSRTVDFGASDDPTTTDALAKDSLLQFPAVIGGVVPVVNVPGIKPGTLKLDSNTLCQIFMTGIRSWNDPAIAALNPGVKLPDSRIIVVHRSDGSGTTAIFTEYLATTCSEWKNKVGAGKAVAWPTGIGGKGNEGVASYVAKTEGGLGYVEFAYAKQNKMSHVLLKNQAGNFVEPSDATFRDAAASGNFDPAKHFHAWLVNAPGKNSWPIAGATFILLAKEKADVNKKVAKFFDWAFKNGDKQAEKLTYVPLPDALKAKVRDYWKKNGIY